jgi:hypothetical protein
MPALHKADVNEWTRHSNAKALESLAYHMSEHHAAQAKKAKPGSTKHQFHMSAYEAHENIAANAAGVYESRITSKAERMPVTFRNQKRRRNLS